MITASGPKVLEYNVRFGDPEVQALMLLLDVKTDLAAILLVKDAWHFYMTCELIKWQATVERRLDSVSLTVRPGFAVSVVIASQGYPGSYDKGKQISIGKPSTGLFLNCRTVIPRSLCRTLRIRHFPRRNIFATR